MRKLLSILRRLAMTSRFIRNALCGIAIGCVLAAASGVAQTACGADGYRVTGHGWDAVLGRGFEYRQDCSHPEWPARLVMLGASAGERMAGNTRVAPVTVAEVAFTAGPLLVTAGAPVRLWMQDAMVRIEMNGVSERSARNGEHVMVQVTHQSDETGLSVERLAGIVRGSGEVEIER